MDEVDEREIKAAFYTEYSDAYLEMKQKRVVELDVCEFAWACFAHGWLSAKQKRSCPTAPGGTLTIYRCGHCNFEGHAYGTLIGDRVSAPWCPRCQRNDKLAPVPQPKPDQPK